MKEDPTTQSATDRQRAANKAEMEKLRKKWDEEDEALDGQLIVIEGANIKFGSHLGTFTVSNDVPTIQDKLTGTIVENKILNFTFKDGFQLLSTMKWQDFGNVKVQDNEVLLKKSFLPATGKMPGNSPVETGKIEFVDSGQRNEPESIKTAGAPMPEQHQRKQQCNGNFTLSQIQRIWPNAINAEWLQGIIDELNAPYKTTSGVKKLFDIFDLNTCTRRAHFFAQAFVESGSDLSGAFVGEGFNYTVDALRSGYPFSIFKKNKAYYDKADQIGRKELKDNKTGKKTVIQKADQEAIANIAYDDANRMDGYKLGNTVKGDGWNFRGRGLLQITGRNNYDSIQKIIDMRLPISGIDLASGSDTFSAKEAVFAGLGDWVYRDANTTADRGKTHEVVNAITKKINYSTKSYEARRDAFDRISQIFNDEK